VSPAACNGWCDTTEPPTDIQAKFLPGRKITKIGNRLIEKNSRHGQIFKLVNKKENNVKLAK